MSVNRQLVALMIREDVLVMLTENDKEVTSIEGIAPFNPFS
jgi:hypothetical protein